jgi:hypothetical protein
MRWHERQTAAASQTSTDRPPLRQRSALRVRRGAANRAPRARPAQPRSAAHCARNAGTPNHCHSAPTSPRRHRWQLVQCGTQWCGRVAAAGRCRPVAYVPRQPSPAHPRPAQARPRHSSTGKGQTARAGAPRQGPGGPGSRAGGQGSPRAVRRRRHRGHQAARAGQASAVQSRLSVVGRLQPQHSKTTGTDATAHTTGGGPAAAAGSRRHTTRHGMQPDTHSAPPAAPPGHGHALVVHRSRPAQRSRARPAQGRTVTGQPAPGMNSSQHSSTAQPYITAPHSTTQQRHDTTYPTSYAAGRSASLTV